MNPVTLLIGVAAVLFGVFSAYLRISQPSELGKLAAMKKQWGDSAGNIIHLVAYTVTPMVLGAVLIVTGFRGGSLF